MFGVDIKYPFFKMAQLYKKPNIESEHWEIKTFQIHAPEDYHCILDSGIPAGEYVALRAKNYNEMGLDCACMMSDTPMEKYTNQLFLNLAEGDVLLVGLGIGMLTAALAQKESVKSITVVELDSEIIGLVEPLIREHVPHQDKIKIIQGDAYVFPKEYNGPLFDYIWIDIWETFPGWFDELDMLNNIMELYFGCVKESYKVYTWGSREAFEGFDISPIEDDDFIPYVKDMVALEIKRGETDFGIQEMRDNYKNFHDVLISMCGITIFDAYKAFGVEPVIDTVIFHQEKLKRIISDSHNVNNFTVTTQNGEKINCAI